MILNKGDLEYNYEWNAYGGDDPEITGEPDSTLFHRNEGYEALYLINKIMEKHGLNQKSDGEKIERMIKNYLPGNIRSQEDVEKWIEDNWENYE